MQHPLSGSKCSSKPGAVLAQRPAQQQASPRSHRAQAHLHLGEGLDVRARLGGRDEGQLLIRRRALWGQSGSCSLVRHHPHQPPLSSCPAGQNSAPAPQPPPLPLPPPHQRADDELELVDVVLAREQRLALQQLRQDAAHWAEGVDAGRGGVGWGEEEGQEGGGLAVKHHVASAQMASTLRCKGAGSRKPRACPAHLTTRRCLRRTGRRTAAARGRGTSASQRTQS